MNKLYKKIQERISLRQSIYISKRISFLLEAGVSLPNAFQLIAGQMKKRGTILVRIADSVSHGRSITEVISETNIFGASAMPLLKIGEESGTLAESFSALSDELEKRALLKQKMIGAIIYPACITAGMLVLIIVLMTVVFPKMLGVFESLHVALPLSTRILIWLSSGLRRFGLIAGLLLSALCVFFTVYYRRSAKFHLRVDKTILRIPVISSFIRVYMLASISNVLGLLLANHSPLISALNVSAQTCGNLAYRQILKNVSDQVSGGMALGQALNSFPRAFSREYCDLISIGEQTGKLSETFAYAHVLYSRDLDVLTKSLSSSVEPVLMVVVGLAIGVVAMAVVSPMYSITSHLHGS